jgi:hypothetical protein
MYTVIVRRDLKGKVITSRLGPFVDHGKAEDALLQAYTIHGIFLIDAKIVDDDADA